LFAGVNFAAVCDLAEVEAFLQKIRKRAHPEPPSPDHGPARQVPALGPDTVTVEIRQRFFGQSQTV
jgi:hypothetical protein